MTFLCPECGKECEEHYTFCPSCGKKNKYEQFCSKCGNPFTLLQSFCVKCGNKLSNEEKEIETKKKWKLFPVSIILYLTILVVHLIFFLIFQKGMAKNLAIVSIFDAVMIFIWSSIPVYNIKSILKLKYDFKWWHIPAFFLTVTALFFFAMAFVKLLQWWLELPQRSMVKTLNNNGYSMTAIILIICVQPAIIEELAFRGIIYKALESALKPRETILISAFLFAMLHLSFISMPHLMLLGTFFGYLRYKTKSIWPSSLAHFLHNFGAVMVDKYNLF